MKKQQENNLNWPTAIRDVFIHSMNKGQLPVFLLGAFMILTIWKMPEDDVGLFVKTLFSKETPWFGPIGYILWLVTIIGWLAHFKIMRNHYVNEITRIADERNKHQKESVGQDGVASSEPNS